MMNGCSIFRLAWGSPRAQAAWHGVLPLTNQLARNGDRSDLERRHDIIDIKRKGYVPEQARHIRMLFRYVVCAPAFYLSRPIAAAKS
jgi:hypothetical protein